MQTIYTMTKVKLNTKQIDSFSLKYPSFEDYLKGSRINIINLGNDKPINRFLEIEKSNGQATSRHRESRQNEIETNQNEKLMTIGDYEDETPCTCKAPSGFFSLTARKAECTCGKSDETALFVK